MKKKNVIVTLLSILLLSSCTNIEVKPNELRHNWTNDEINKIDKILFQDANKLIPCYALENIKIQENVSNDSNVKSSMLVKTGVARDEHLNEYNAKLLNANFIFNKEVNTYDYNIDEKSYLSCETSLKEDSLIYVVNYINKERVQEPVPVEVRKTWNEDEIKTITEKFKEDISFLLPCYAFSDSKLVDGFNEYGCISLETSETKEESVVDDFINELKNNGYSYFENGAFYYKFKDEKKEKFVAIQTYIDPSSKSFVIDYYLTENHKCDTYKTTFTDKEKADIDAHLGKGVSDLLPLYMSDIYEIDYKKIPSTLLAYCLSDLDSVNVFEKMLIEKGYKYIEESYAPYYEFKNENFIIQVSVAYYPDGTFEVMYIIEALANLDNVRTEWTNEEKAFFITAFNKDISSFVPCFIPEGGSLEEYKDTEHDIHCLYIQTPNGSQGLINSLTNILIRYGYVAEYDAEAGDYTYNYEINKNTYINVDVYLGSDNSFNYDIYYKTSESSIDTPTTDNIKSDIKITPDLFNAQYPGGETPLLVNGMNTKYERIMKTTKNGVFSMQISSAKKGSGLIYNQNELHEINKIVLTKVTSDYAPQNNSYLTVYKSNDGISYEVVQSRDKINYEFNGARYFKIVNETENALYYSEIFIDFRNL